MKLESFFKVKGKYWFYFIIIVTAYWAWQLIENDGSIFGIENPTLALVLHASFLVWGLVILKRSYSRGYF